MQIFGVKLAILTKECNKNLNLFKKHIMNKMIKVTKFAILALLILSLPYIEKAMAQFNPSSLSRVRLLASNGGEYMPGLDPVLVTL